MRTANFLLKNIISLHNAKTSTIINDLNLFYRYYSKGNTKAIPYFSTLCAMVMLLGLHIFQLLILFNKTNILPAHSNNTRAQNYVIIALCLIPLFFLTSFLIPKKVLQRMEYDDEKIKRGS